MAVVTYSPFATNPRIVAASVNSPPIQIGEPNHTAVKILQQAIIDAGFTIRDGADGSFGQFTAEAVRSVQVKYDLGRDSGVAGREVITKLDEVLGGRAGGPARQGITVLEATLSIMIQRTRVSMPVNLQHYLTTTADLCSRYGLKLDVIDRQDPRIDFAGTYNSAFDVPSIRKASEKQTPGRMSTLRVIMAEFDGGSSEWGVTEGASRSGMQVRDFIVLNTGKIKANGNTMLHEMIHAAGLSKHDLDTDSVFAQGTGGLHFKPEHAFLVGTSFYSDRVAGI